MLQKSIHAGSIYTLPEDVKLTEPQIKSWLAAFLAMFKDDEQIHITQTWWLWRENDENELRARNGIPNSIEQIQWLFKTKRLTACMFEPRLSLAEVSVIKTINELNETKREFKSGALVACDICNSSSCTTVTCASIVETFNKVARTITGGQCQTIQSLFGAAANIRKTITKLRTQLGNLLHSDLIFQFENADFTNWKALSNGIRRVYDIQETKNTMVSIFQQLNGIINSNKRAEVKVAAFKNLINRLTIKSEDDFISARDMEGKKVFMNHPEEYNVIINTLFTYMLAQQIPESKWPALQEDFERKIQAGWSYKNWHENRPKLYELIDKIQEQKPSRAINQVTQAKPAQIELDYPSTLDISEIEETRRKFRPKSAPTSRSNSGAQEKSIARNRSASIDRNNSRGQMTYSDRKEANDRAEKSKANLCIHCTTNNDRQVAIYHPPGTGFGGTGSCCIYDTDGEFNGPKARGLIQEIYDSNELSFLADQNVFEVTNRYSAFSDEDDERDSTRESPSQLCAVREGKIVNNSLPVIQGNFATNKSIASGNRRGSLTFDSGAARSFLHESHLEHLRHERSRPITREYFGAGGVKLKIRRHYYNVWISLDQIGEVCFKETLISTEEDPFRDMLVGRTDMRQLQVHIDFGKGTLGITKWQKHRGGFKTWLFNMTTGTQSRACHENFIGGLKMREVSNTIGNTNYSNTENETSRNRSSENPDRAREIKRKARPIISPAKRSATIYDQLSDPALSMDLVETIYSKRYLTFLDLSHDNERKAEADAAKFDCDHMLKIMKKRAKSIETTTSKPALSEEIDKFEKQKSAARSNRRVKRLNDCFSFKNRGECPRGENCRYQHDPKFEKKKKAKTSRTRADSSMSDNKSRLEQPNSEQFSATDGKRGIMVERAPIKATSRRSKHDRSQTGCPTNRTVK